jgi:outer membrane protein TolC
MAALVIALLCSFAVSAGTITFEGVLDDAIYLSGETRLARIDEVISQRAKQEATSAFYPRLYLSLGTNYLYDYANKPGYTTINGIYYDTASQWQSTFSANAEYDLFNPNQALRPYLQASDNHRMQRYSTKLTEKSVMLEVVNIYESILTAYYSAEIYRQMAEVSLELYNVHKRLNEAGLTDKQVYYMAGVAAADYQTKAMDALRSFSEGLTQLSYYTGTKYNEETIPAYFKDYDNVTPPKLTDTPEYKTAELRISRNDTEMMMHNLSTLPTVSMFLSYNFTGYDREKTETSRKDMELANYRIGLNANLTLFDGMSYFYIRSRLKAESYRLVAEKRQIIDRINAENERLLNAIKYQRLIKESVDGAAALTEEVMTMGQTLKEANITGTAELLERKLDTLEKLLEQRIILIGLSADGARLYVAGRIAEESRHIEQEKREYRMFMPEDWINKQRPLKYR